MTNRNYIPHLHDPELREFHARDLPDQSIAEEMGFSRSLIQKRRVALGLVANRAYVKRGAREREDSPKSAPQPELNPVAASVLLLGAEQRGEKGYFWKGRPISAKDLVIEANRLRKARCQDQLGPPTWRVL